MLTPDALEIEAGHGERQVDLLPVRMHGPGETFRGNHALGEA